MEQNEIINMIENMEDKKLNHASEIEPLSFMTENIQKINKKKIIFLNENVDRPLMISQLAQLLKNIDMAVKLEAGIFEFTIIYSTMKNYVSRLMPPIYLDKFQEIMLNLDENNNLENKTLKNSLLNEKMNPQIVAFLRPVDLHPDRWSDLVKKFQLKEEKKKNMAVTDLYQCPKCKERRCRAVEMQCRSSDESMTKFITCTNCFHVMRK